MFCSQCGKEISDNSKFCNHCGASVKQSAPMHQSASVQQSPSVQRRVTTIPEDMPKKKGKIALVVGLIVLALALVAGGVTVLILNRPVNKIRQAFAAGDVDTAVALYDEITSAIEMEKVTSYACSYAMELKDYYLSEATDMDSDTICGILSKLDVGITIDNKEIAETKDLIERVGISRDNYEEGQAAEEAGKNVEALNRYRAVIAEDTVYYELAQTAISAISDTLRAEAIAEVNNLADAGDFDGAMAKLNSTLDILIDDAELLAEKTALDQKIISDYVVKAEAAAIEEKYSEALVYITQALEKYPENSDILGVKDLIPEEAYLIGSWKMSFDFSEILGIMYSEFAGVDIPLKMTLMLTFREDGTYYFAVDEEALMDAYMEYILEFTYISFEQEGISRKEAAELVELLYGMSIEEYIYMLCEQEMETMTDELSESGDYVVNGNKLYLSDAVNHETFVVSGNTLTIDLPGENAGAEIFPGVKYPLIFERADNVIAAEGSI
uniref:zinc-ribbon domain-containing protein n=1 Tax=Acetatifactor sp. TaxID=1872090 RepID=UPI00405632F3